MNQLFNAYKQALWDELQQQVGEAADKQKTQNRIGGLAQWGVGQLLPQASTAVSPILGGYTNALLATGAEATGSSIAPTASTTPWLSGLTASTPAASVGPTVASSSGAGAAAAAGSGASSGVSTLGATGIGALIAAGLMVGGAKPGSWLFPVKKSGYWALNNLFYKPTGGLVLDKVLGGYSPQGIVNSIWGDPYQQEKDEASRLAKARQIAGIGAIQKIQRGQDDEGQD